MNEKPSPKLNWDGTGYTGDSIISVLTHIKELASCAPNYGSDADRIVAIFEYVKKVLK